MRLALISLLAGCALAQTAIQPSPRPTPLSVSRSAVKEKLVFASMAAKDAGTIIETVKTADGGDDLVVTLASKPTVNSWSWTIAGVPVNAEWSLQQPLWQEQGLPAATAACSDTDCTTPDGAVIHRDLNVVGSYAVYDGDRKLFHIYRPQAIDAKGRAVWGSLRHEGNQITETIPADWLAKASYPVVIDPTIGYETQGATTVGFNGLIGGVAFTAPSVGTANPGTISLYCDTNGSGSVNSLGGVYASSGGSPSGQSLLSNNNSLIPCGSAGAWQSASITWPTITSGTTYELAIHGNSSFRIRYDAGTSGQAQYKALTYTGTLPATFPTGLSSQAWKLSIYVTYSSSDGSSTRRRVIVSE